MSDDATVLEESRVDPIALFTPQVALNVYGLAFVGHIQKDINFCGHTFTLKTLRPSEKAAAGIAAQPWRDTITEGEVWANAQVALALVSVDDDINFCPPVGPDLNAFAKARLNFCTNSETGWHGPTLGFLYNEYLVMEQEALDGVRELQDLSERNLNPSSPSPDSLTAPGTSIEPILSDILL